MNRQWAIVEAMGHRRYAGQVTLELGLVRIDIPDVEGPLYLGAGAIFAISPCAEAVARQAATGPYVDQPVPSWARLPETPPAPAIAGAVEDAQELHRRNVARAVRLLDDDDDDRDDDEEADRDDDDGFPGDDDYQATGTSEPTPHDIDCAKAEVLKHGPVTVVDPECLPGAVRRPPPEPIERSAAWLAGEAHGHALRGLREHNPHKPGTEDHAEWDAGFQSTDVPF